MKRTILITTIILCLVVFVTTLIAGIVLTFSTIGWKALLSVDQLDLNGNRLSDQIKEWSSGLHFGPLNTYTIDETKTDPLTGIDTIIITGISEKITVTAEGAQMSGRMKGTYRASTELVWSLTRNGQTLRLKADYPRWGFRSSDLAIDVQIPKSYKGTIEIHSVSGDCTIINTTDTNWSTVDFTGVSGSLSADTANWPKIEANSVSGEIQLAAVTGKADLKTVSSKITVSIKATEPKDLKAESVSGRIALSVPESARFTVSFDTVSGSFDSSQLPVQITSQVKRRIDASRNGGGGTFTVKTVSGSLQFSPAN